MIRLSTIVTVAGILTLAGRAPAAAQSSTPAYGVDSLSSYVLSAWDMEAQSSATGWAPHIQDGLRYISAGGGSLLGVVHVPQGARILSMEVEGCDESGTGNIEVRFYRSQAGNYDIIGLFSTGLFGTPGCGRFAENLLSPETVDNDSYVYIIFFENEPLDGSTRIGAVRFYYELQVSPAPATATFNDVPTSDPAFQFIEALASSGITVGCGTNIYCPDAPLTRRQMAVFLAKALGLHWPNGFPVGMQGPGGSIPPVFP